MTTNSLPSPYENTVAFIVFERQFVTYKKVFRLFFTKLQMELNYDGSDFFEPYLSAALDPCTSAALDLESAKRLREPLNEAIAMAEMLKGDE